MPSFQVALRPVAALPLIVATLASTPAEAAAHNTWSAGAPLPTALYAAAATVLGGKIYVIGGESGASLYNIVQIYDPAAKTWSAGVPLPVALRGEAAVTIGNTIYVLAGYSSPSTTSAAVYSFTAGATAWQTLASAPTAAGDVAAAIAGKTIFLIGGNTNTATRCALIQASNTATNKWAAAGGDTTNEETGDTKSLKPHAIFWTNPAAEPAQANQACT